MDNNATIPNLSRGEQGEYLMGSQLMQHNHYRITTRRKYTFYYSLLFVNSFIICIFACIKALLNLILTLTSMTTGYWNLAHPINRNCNHKRHQTTLSSPLYRVTSSDS